jgi:hypothetical protein
LRKELRALDRKSTKAIKVAGDVAAAIVVAEARPRVPVVSGRARRTVKVASTTTVARVAGGSKAVPYYGWLDFGGRAGPGRRQSRPFIRSGRYIWAAFLDRLPDVERALESALVDAAQDAGLAPRRR